VMFSCGRYCSMLKDIFATNQVYMINLGVIRVTLSAKKKKLLSLISSKINYIVHAIMCGVVPLTQPMGFHH
jgi:hypothetical protein